MIYWTKVGGSIRFSYHWQRAPIWRSAILNTDCNLQWQIAAHRKSRVGVKNDESGAFCDAWEFDVRFVVPPHVGRGWPYWILDTFPLLLMKHLLKGSKLFAWDNVHASVTTCRMNFHRGCRIYLRSPFEGTAVENASVFSDVDRVVSLFNACDRTTNKDGHSCTKRTFQTGGLQFSRHITHALLSSFSCLSSCHKWLCQHASPEDPGSGQEWLQGRGRSGSRIRAGVAPGSGQEGIQGQGRSRSRVGAGADPGSGQELTQDWPRRVHQAEVDPGLGQAGPVNPRGKLQEIWRGFPCGSMLWLFLSYSRGHTRVHPMSSTHLHCTSKQISSHSLPKTDKKPQCTNQSLSRTCLLRETKPGNLAVWDVSQQGNCGQASSCRGTVRLKGEIQYDLKYLQLHFGLCLQALFEAVLPYRLWLHFVYSMGCCWQKRTCKSSQYKSPPLGLRQRQMQGWTRETQTSSCPALNHLGLWICSTVSDPLHQLARAHTDVNTPLVHVTFPWLLTPPLFCGIQHPKAFCFWNSNWCIPNFKQHMCWARASSFVSSRSKTCHSKA